MGRWLTANSIDPDSNEYLEEAYKQSEERHENDGSDEIGEGRMNDDVPKPKSN